MASNFTRSLLKKLREGDAGAIEKLTAKAYSGMKAAAKNQLPALKYKKPPGLQSEVAELAATSALTLALLQFRRQFDIKSTYPTKRRGPRDHAADLDAQQVSKSLKGIFSKKKMKLPEEHTVTVLTPGSKWRIDAPPKQYTVDKINDLELRVTYLKEDDKMFASNAIFAAPDPWKYICLKLLGTAQNKARERKKAYAKAQAKSQRDPHYDDLPESIDQIEDDTPLPLDALVSEEEADTLQAFRPLLTRLIFSRLRAFANHNPRGTQLIEEVAALWFDLKPINEIQAELDTSNSTVDRRIGAIKSQISHLIHDLHIFSLHLNHESISDIAEFTKTEPSEVTSTIDRLTNEIPHESHPVVAQALDFISNFSN